MDCQAWYSTYFLFGVLCLAEAGCTALPQTFTRIDGRVLDRKQLLTDQTMCRGEIKSNLSTGNQTTALGPTEDVIAVYTGCMAQPAIRLQINSLGEWRAASRRPGPLMKYADLKAGRGICLALPPFG